MASFYHWHRKKIIKLYERSFPSRLTQFLNIWDIHIYNYVYIYIYTYLYIYIYGGSWNGGTPKSSIYKWIFHEKQHHFGVPPFMETAIYISHVSSHE